MEVGIDLSAHLFNSSFMRMLPTVGAAIMALLVIAVRMKAAKSPTSMRKIIIPPLGMSTGFLMFLFPFMRIPFGYALVSFTIGLLLSVPLIRTSEFQVIGGEVYLKRSRAFIIVLLGLLVLRLLLHSYVEEYVTLAQTGAVFFVLAFGMILLWRIMMVVRYNEVIRSEQIPRK